MLFSFDVMILCAGNFVSKI